VVPDPAGGRDSDSNGEMALNFRDSN